MRNINQEFKDYMKNGETTNAYFMDIVCKSGEIVRINSTNIDISTDINLIPKEVGQPPYIYKSGGYIPSEYSYSSDGSVQKMDITGLANQGFFEYLKIINNYYEGAEIFVSICNYNDISMGQVKLARGFLGNFDIDSNGKFTCEYRGFAQKMNNSTSRLYTFDCKAALFDGQCKLKESNFVEIAGITKNIDSITYTLNSLSKSPDYYVGGKITITSGEAKGLVGQVRSANLVSNNVIEIELIKPFSISPNKGDSINIRPGCDKKITTCKNKFDNVENFRGEPFIPGDNVFNVIGDGQESQKSKSNLLK